MDKIQKAKEQAEKLIAKYIGTTESRRIKSDYLRAKIAYGKCLKANFITQYMAGGKDAEDINKVCVAEKLRMDSLDREVHGKL